MKIKLIYAIIVLVFVPCAALLAADNVVDIGTRRELFVDKFIVGEFKQTTLKLHTPQKMKPISPARPHGHYATV